MYRYRRELFRSGAAKRSGAVNFSVLTVPSGRVVVAVLAPLGSHTLFTMAPSGLFTVDDVIKLLLPNLSVIVVPADGPAV